MASDITCPFCDRVTRDNKDTCIHCGHVLWVARLVSRGSGFIPGRFTCNLQPKTYTFGRSENNSFIIPCSTVPNMAVKLLYKDSFRKFIVEPQAPKGIFINGKELAYNERVALHDGDILRIVSDEFEFQTMTTAASSDGSGSDSGYTLAHSLQQTVGYINELYSATNFEDLAQKAVDAVIDVTKMRRGYLFMVEHDLDSNEIELQPVIARSVGGTALANSKFDISQSLIQRVLAGEGMVVIQDAVQEDMQTNTMRMHQLRALVCLPITVTDEQTYTVQTVGIIYADNFLPTVQLPPDCAATLRMFAQAVSNKYQLWQDRTGKSSKENIYADAIFEVTRFLGEIGEQCQQLSDSESDCLKQSTLQELASEVRSATTQLSNLIRSHELCLA